jgi:hypothetical protein
LAETAFALADFAETTFDATVLDAVLPAEAFREAAFPAAFTDAGFTAAGFTAADFAEDFAAAALPAVVFAVTTVDLVAGTRPAAEAPGAAEREADLAVAPVDLPVARVAVLTVTAAEPDRAAVTRLVAALPEPAGPAARGFTTPAACLADAARRVAVFASTAAAGTARGEPADRGAGALTADAAAARAGLAVDLVAAAARFGVPGEFLAPAGVRDPVPEGGEPAPEAAGLVEAFLAAGIEAAGIEVFLLANDCGHVRAFGCAVPAGIPAPGV